MNTTKFIISFLVISSSFFASNEIGAQSKIPAWKTLSKITFTTEYDELMGYKVDKPVFSKVVEELDGQIIELKGYIIPTEGYKSHREFVFSAFPYNMCFFCGGAGPETVMEVYATEPIDFTAERIVIRGKLGLNKDDINRLMYHLTDAVQVK